MKDQYSNIDDFFRKRFENFNPEPPARIWEKIINRLHPGGGSGIFRTFIFSALSLISVGIIVLLITNPLSTDKNTVANPINKNDIISDQKEESINKEKEIKEFYVKPPEINNDLSKREKDQLAAQDPNQNYNKIKEKYTEHKAEEKTVTRNYANIISLAENNSVEISKRSSNVKALGLRSKINGINISLSDNNDQYRSKSINNILKIGPFINPEVVFYPSDDTVSSSQNYNFGIDLRYHWSNFFIQTGLGVSIAKDEGSYDIGYNKYLGSYPDVYYVTIDSTEQGYIPVYHTKNVDVYDTIPHYSIRESTNTYTYLQIPLLFGYQIERPKLTYSLRAGPCLSVLMHENISNPDFPGDISVFSLNKQVAKRTETNWQLMVIAGLNYKAGKNIEITLEPTFRYYLKSAYESKLIKTKHPYAVGIRAGLLFNF